jgi:nucleoid DNA-binding protein
MYLVFAKHFKSIERGLGCGSDKRHTQDGRNISTKAKIMIPEKYHEIFVPNLLGK